MEIYLIRSYFPLRHSVSTPPNETAREHPKEHLDSWKKKLSLSAAIPVEIPYSARTLDVKNSAQILLANPLTILCVGQSKYPYVVDGSERGKFSGEIITVLPEGENLKLVEREPVGKEEVQSSMILPSHFAFDSVKLYRSSQSAWILCMVDNLSKLCFSTFNCQQSQLSSAPPNSTSQIYSPTSLKVHSGVVIPCNLKMIVHTSKFIFVEANARVAIMSLLGMEQRILTKSHNPPVPIHFLESTGCLDLSIRRNYLCVLCKTSLDIYRLSRLSKIHSKVCLPQLNQPPRAKLPYTLCLGKMVVYVIFLTHIEGYSLTGFKTFVDRTKYLLEPLDYDREILSKRYYRGLINSRSVIYLDQVELLLCLFVNGMLAMYTVGTLPPIRTELETTDRKVILEVYRIDLQTEARCYDLVYSPKNRQIVIVGDPRYILTRKINFVS